ncbi:MAG: aspartate carbamoyltransferase catalytic subunit [Opitutales bacterium]
MTAAPEAPPEPPVDVWTRKDLLGIGDLTVPEIEAIFANARAFKKQLERPHKRSPILQGRSVVMAFFEPSTRTKLAFDAAAQRLSADVSSFSASSSSVSKGESLRDTVRNIEALKADAIIIRHRAAGSAKYVSECVEIPVINAGDGAHEHPTQALLDVFTLREHFGDDLRGKRVTILGDILFSRVARSNIWLLTKLGVEVTLAGPATLVPRGFTAMGEGGRVRVTHDLKDGLTGADAVMLLRIQHERQTPTHFPSLGEYTSQFGLHRGNVGMLKPEAIIMHPGPINRGVELDNDLADSPRSVILSQVTNGIAVRMAVLFLCSSAGGRRA